MAGIITTRRVYDPAEAGDGMRVLVDRLWPRGLRKEDARLDHWLREVAPSNELRKWFGHDPARWEEFKRRYAEELAGNPALADLENLVRQSHVTLLYGAHDRDHNQAVALAAYLRSRSG
ncbi:uroporphyrin-III c-methyltransferase [Devosia sp. H5989]|nr:uroporphyrin-III c-methyltransferase [Devosia sp. H5989]